MVVHFPLWVKIMPDFGDVRALSAAIAPDAAGVIIGRKNMSANRSITGIPMLIIPESTTPGSAQFTLIPLSATRFDKSNA